MGLSPVTLGMVGLQFALFANALALLGVDAEPEDEGAPDPGKSVGVAGSLIGALSLIFMSLWLVIGAPFGTKGMAAEIQVMFSAISGMYGFLFLGFGLTQINGWDVRPVGNVALGAAIIQLIEIVIILVRWPMHLHNVLQVIVLIIYLVALLGFWRTTHGNQSPVVQGWILLLAWVATFYYMIWSGGMLPAPV